VVRSRSRTETHHFGGAGYGAVERCGTGSDISGPDPDAVRHKIFKVRFEGVEAELTNFLTGATLR
jgi:hypothetical protein